MQPTKYIVKDIKGRLNVRNDAGEVIAKLEKGTEVTVTEIKDGQTETGPLAKINEGWVAMEFLIKAGEKPPVAKAPDPAVVPAPAPVTADAGGRAPWMKIVLNEAKNYGGYKEGEDPLRSRIKSAYFNINPGGDKNDPTKTAWCAAFACWCLEKTGYPNPRSYASQSFRPEWKSTTARGNQSRMRKINEPVYGCLIVWNDTKTPSHGHVAFCYGKQADGRLIALGGNQSDSLKFTARKPGGEWGQVIVGYYLPENYQDNELDKFTAAELKLNQDTLNSGNLLAKAIKGKTGTESTR
jgi:uncharacterized protein (TIGR02594 family)